jgi:hypothetical protein
MYAQTVVALNTRKLSIRTFQNHRRVGESPHFCFTTFLRTATTTLLSSSRLVLFSCSNKPSIAPTCNIPAVSVEKSIYHVVRWQLPSLMIIRRFSSYEEEEEASFSFTSNNDTTNNKIATGPIKRLSWDGYVEELKKFRQDRGHLMVPKDYPNEVYGFMQKQRKLYRKAMKGEKTSLTPDKIKQLTDLGFVWNLMENKWDVRYSQLKRHYEKEGTSNVILRHKASPQLVKWASHQRYMHYRLQMNRSTTLTEERIKKLNDIGFSWDLHQSEWMATFEELRSMLRNDDFASFKVSEARRELRTWVTYQRQQLNAFKAGKPSALTPDKVEKLKIIQFGKGRSSWKSKFDEWIEYKSKQGNSSGFCKEKQYPKEISSWIIAQKREYSKFQQGKPSYLNKKKVDLLLKEGFNFNMESSKWDIMFEEWKEFRDKLLFWKEQRRQGCKNTRRPQGSKALSFWITQQKRLFLSNDERKSALTSHSLEKIERLHKERFFEEFLLTYSPRNVGSKSKEGLSFHDVTLPSMLAMSPEWLDMFKALKKYKEKHGDCQVSPVSDQNLSLWVEEQSRCYANGTLTKGQIIGLLRIGLDLRAELERWNNMFRQMSHFFSEHGHCVVPSNDVSLRPLFDWAQRQREIRALLTKSQYDSLCSCDFPWDENEAVWKEMIFALRSFRSDHGHCAVPQIYLPYPSLALWVLQMRQQYERWKRGEETILCESKIEELEKEGFVWDESAREWDIRYKELVDFFLTNGHCSVPLWYPLNPPLGHWVVMQQRQLDLMRKGLPYKLTDESVRLLEKMGL